MAHVWILLGLVVYMYIAQSRVIASKYYVSNQAVTWRKAAENCTLATPKINYTPDGELVKLESDLDLGGQDKLWVGYTSDYQVFRYIGCVPEKAVKSQARFTINQNIGLCYSACSSTEYKYFGVKISAGASNSAECTCITDISEQNVKSCEIDSGYGGSEFAFGGESTMAIYTLASTASVFTNSSTLNNNATNCFSYANPTHKAFGWVECGERYEYICSLMGDFDKPQPPTFGTWKEAAEMCSSKEQTMSLYHENIGQIKGSGELWMSYIKVMSISSTKGQTPSEHIRYGYIKKVNGTFVLEFSKDGNMIKALCSKGDTTAISSTDAGSNSVGVYVGVSVAIILVAVASAVAIIIWKRRQRPVDTKVGNVNNSTGNLTYQHSDTIVDSHPNKTRHLEIDIKETTHGGYETVQDGLAFQNKLPSPNTNTKKRETNFKMSESLDAKNNGYSYAKEIGTNNGDDTSGSDTYHTVGGETEGNSQYDHLTGPNGHVTKTDGKIHDDDEDHMYDKTEVVNTDYDHITSGPITASNTAGVQDYDTTSNVKAKRGHHSTRGINGPANTVEINDYDTTSNVKAKPDPTYDHAGV